MVGGGEFLGNEFSKEFGGIMNFSLSHTYSGENFDASNYQRDYGYTPENQYATGGVCGY